MPETGDFVGGEILRAVEGGRSRNVGSSDGVVIKSREGAIVPIVDATTGMGIPGAQDALDFDVVSEVV